MVCGVIVVARNKSEAPLVVVGTDRLFACCFV